MKQPMMFIKKPIAVEAMQVTVFNLDEVVEWCKGELFGSRLNAKDRAIKFNGYEARVKDWIVRDDHGIFRVHKPAVFEALYERVE